MKRLFRPLTLVVAILALGAVLTAWAFWPAADEDREIAWLYAATNTANWERFVTGVKMAAERLRTSNPGLDVQVNDRKAFPKETTTDPEIVVSVPGTKGKLRFRWCKLTSERNTSYWVKTLVQSKRAPLAIIGGSSSDLAIELAKQLQTRRQATSVPPLLLLTTATTDEIPDPTATTDEISDRSSVRLNSLYDGYTYRFCFTNEQMARSVTDFIWHQEDLCPDTDRVYLRLWEDDPYSLNLGRRFIEAVKRPTMRGFRAASNDWARLAGFAATGGLPLDLWRLRRNQFHQVLSPLWVKIPSSVAFDQPNPQERAAASSLIEDLRKHHSAAESSLIEDLLKRPAVQQPLLILPAASQPVRRFLRGLMRNDPVEARRLVVATGDAIQFNTVYRDRQQAWPIQDLPFRLVFFCHCNPVDLEAGFKPESVGWPGLSPRSPGDEANAGASRTQPRPPIVQSIETEAIAPAGVPMTTGTEDLLLYLDMVEALVQSAFEDKAGERRLYLPATGKELGEKLKEARLQKGRVRFKGNARLFDDQGNRQWRTGEHIVCVRPQFEEDRVLPQSVIEVWARQEQDSTGKRWRRIQELLASYEGD